MTLGIKHLYLRQFKLKHLKNKEQNANFESISLEKEIHSPTIKIKNKIYIDKIICKENKLYLLE